MSSPVLAVRPTDNVAHAKNLMLRHGVRRLVVVEKGESVGMLSIHDIAERLNRGAPEWRRRPIDQIPVARVMHRGVISASVGTGLNKAAKLMLNHDISSLVVVEGGSVAGILTKTDITKYFASNLHGKFRVATLMTPDPVVVNRGHSIARVVELMEEYSVARVVVVEGKRPVGIISTSDVGFSRIEEPPHGGREREVKYVRRLERGARPTARYVKHVAMLTAEDIMRPDPVTVNPDSDAAEAAELMLEHGIGGLPVVEDKKLVGVLTKTDLVRGIDRLGLQ
jgi:CBS domain-containing protein